MSCRTEEDILADIAFVDEVKKQLQAAMLTNNSNYTVKKHELNDTQVDIKTEYRSLKEILDGITSLTRQRNALFKELHGGISYGKNYQTFRR